MDQTSIEIRVRYAETDQMGRAHHMHHLVWAEAGRTAWLSERGASYAALEERGVFLPVSRVTVDYRRAVRYEDSVRVCTWPERVGSRRVTFRYTISRVSDGERVADVETDLICMDSSQRVRRLPPDLRAIMQGAETAG